ncbi:MAG: ATPase domain-containing protein [archaeon]
MAGQLRAGSGIDFLRTLPPESSFFLKSGQTASNLMEMSSHLKNIDENTFAHHITPHKNDIATWVYHAIGDRELADVLSNIKSKEKISKLIDARILHLGFTTGLLPQEELPLYNKIFPETKMFRNLPVNDSQVLTNNMGGRYPEVLQAGMSNSDKGQIFMDVPPEEESLEDTKELPTKLPAEGVDAKAGIEIPMDLPSEDEMLWDETSKAAGGSNDVPNKSSKASADISSAARQASQTSINLPIDIPSEDEEFNSGLHTEPEQKEAKPKLSPAEPPKIPVMQKQKTDENARPSIPAKPVKAQQMDSKQPEAIPLNKKQAEPKHILKNDESPQDKKNAIMDRIRKKTASQSQGIDIIGMSTEDILKKLNIIDSSMQYTAMQEIKVQADNVGKTKLLTGVPGFDDLIEGGIPKGSKILLSGGPGSGKTTFCIQQLGYAAEQGERCLYMTFEEGEDKLIEHMEEYGLSPRKYIAQGTLMIKKFDPIKVSRIVEALLAEARGELMIDINEVLDLIPPGFTPDRIVLDSLASVASAFSESQTAYRIYVNQLFDLFDRLGATAFIITEVEGVEKMSHGTIEEFLADGVILFYNLQSGSLKHNALEILKMRSTKHKKKIVPFEFLENKGIEVYPMEEMYGYWLS